MKTSLPWNFLVMLTGIICATAVSHAQDEAEKEISLKKAKGYYETEKLEVINEGDEKFLRITLPGAKPLEGARIKLAEIEGGRLMTVKAKVRGRGLVGTWVQAPNGWVRLPEVSLSDQWREVEIPKVLKNGPNTATVYFVHLPMKAIPPAGTVFEVSDLRVALDPPAEFPSKEVTPKRLAMEEVAPGVKTTIGEGGPCLLIQKSFATQKIPFPQTSQPVNIYVRYRASSVKDRVQISVRPKGAKQIIRQINPASVGWQWVAFPPLTASEAGENIALEAWTDGDATHPAALGAIVIGTGPVLNDEALNAMR